MKNKPSLSARPAGRSLAVSTLLASLALLPLLPAASAAYAPGWGTAVEIQSPFDLTAYSGAPKVSVNAAGEAMVVWIQAGSIVDDLYANHYVPGVGWSGPSLLEFENGVNVRDADVSMNDRGEALAVFSQEYSGFVSILGTRYSPGSGWSAPEVAETDDAGYAISPVVFMDRFGTATVAWVHNDTTNTDIMANRHAPASGWGTPAHLESTPENLYNPSIGGDLAGNVTVLFNQWGGANYSLYANRFNAGTGWSGREQVDLEATDIFTSSLAVGADGTAVAAYRKDSGGRLHAHASIFTPGVGWGAPAQLENNTGEPNEFAAAVDAQGRAVVGWIAPSPSQYHLIASRFTPGSGWGGNEDISSALAGATEPKVAFLPDGSPFAVWRANTPSGYAGLYYTTGFVGSGWATALPVTADRNDGISPSIGVAGDGTVVCAFTRYDSAYGHTWGVLYTPPDTDAPALTVSAPGAGAITAESSIIVSGTAEPGASVIVNGVVAALTSSGNYSVRIALAPGTNTVQVVAVDEAGNLATRTFTVRFDDPLPGVESALDDAQANLTAAQGEVAALQTALAAADARASTLSGALNTSNGRLDAANARLTALENGTGGAGTARADGAAGTASLALMVAILGLLVGAAGIAMAMMKGRAARPAPKEPEPPKSAP